MMSNILKKIKKHKVKSSVIAIFVFMFLAGFIPKVTRDIIAWKNAKSYEYVALYESPKIESGDSTLELSGELKPYLHTEIFSRINGIIKKRYVELGDKVVQGQLLATIDSPDLDEEGQSANAALLTAQKKLLEAEYQYNFNKQSYDRYKQSSQGGAISKQELDAKYNEFKTAEMNYQAAKAEVKRAEAMKNRIQALMDYKNVRAPFNGVISKYNVDAGANVVAGGSSTSTSLFEIQQIDKFRVSLNIPQNYVPFVKIGMEVDLYTPNNPKNKFKGVITQNSQNLDPVSRTMEVVAIINNDDKSGLYPGLYVKSDIHIKGEEKIITVNPACLTTLNTGRYVITVNDTGKIHFQKVLTGRDFGDKVEILEGLNGNENLIINITDDLQDGQTVKSRKNEALTQS
jgi:RND family efflux transporter MFP subunit